MSTSPSTPDSLVKESSAQVAPSTPPKPPKPLKPPKPTHLSIELQPPPAAESLEQQPLTLQTSPDLDGHQIEDNGSAIEAAAEVSGENEAIGKSISTGDEQSATLLNTLKDDVLMTGILTKINRDGNGDVYNFELTRENLTYIETSSTFVASSPKHRTIAVKTLIVRSLDDAWDGDSAHRDSTFRLMSKQKSFYLRAESLESKDAWFSVLDKVANEVQIAELGRLLAETDVAPIMVGKAEVSACQVCSKAFGWMSRRHHCRNCGKCVCEQCSREKVRVTKIDDKALLKVCNDCAREIKSSRKYGVDSYS